MKININYEWNKDSYNKYLDYLRSIGDIKDKEFSSKLIPTKYEILGIKIPVLRMIAKDISKTSFEDFLELTTDTYYEEVMIEGFLLSYIKDHDKFLEYFNRFILKIDNWSLCDCCISSYKIMKKIDFSSKASSLIYSNSEFLQRVGYIMYLDYYIDDDHINDIYHLATMPSDYYYVNMAIAWLLATCFLKYKPMIMDLLKSKTLSAFMQNKTISKIRDSYRVSDEDKEIVKNYRK